MKKLLTLMLSLIFILFTSGCSCNNDDENVDDGKLYSMSEISVNSVEAYLTKDINGETISVVPFNTPISLHYFQKEDIENNGEYFKSEYVRMHMLFDRHYYYYDTHGELINNLRVINESNGEVVSVDEDMISILKEGIRFTKLSKGKFNIGVGNLSSLWDSYIEEGMDIESDHSYIGVDTSLVTNSPSESEIIEAKACIPNYENIETIIVIDDENNTVKVNNLDGCSSGVSITLGALAKSYAAEKIINEERFKNGNYLLNAGQSTIKIIGKNLSRESREWQIGISDSYLTYKNTFPKYATYMMKINKDLSVSTSSGDEKHYRYRDNYYHHIIDPYTGYPNQNRFAVTATCENAMYADIITTSLMSMNLAETKEFLKNLKANNIDVEVIIQDRSEDTLKVYATNNMKNNITIRKNNDTLKEYLNSIVIEELSYES